MFLEIYENIDTCHKYTSYYNIYFKNEGSIFFTVLYIPEFHCPSINYEIQVTKCEYSNELVMNLSKMSDLFNFYYVE